MSEPKEPTEDQPAPSTIPNKAKQARKMKHRSNLQKIFFGIAIGIMIGVLFTQKVVDYLPNILPTLMAVAIAYFVLLTLLILALPSISNYLIKRYTGLRDVDLREAKNIDSKMFESCASIFGIQGLPDSLYTLFKAEIEKTPENYCKRPHQGVYNLTS